jgi:hypothetical protein
MKRFAMLLCLLASCSRQEPVPPPFTPPATNATAKLQRLAADPDVENARAVLDLNTDPDPAVRLTGLRAGVKTVGRRALPWVEKARQDPDPAVRREAVLILAGWADPSDPELPWQWVPLLNDPAPVVADAAAELLRQRGRDLVPIVQQATITADNTFRLRLAQLLTSLKDPELAPSLLWILRSSDWHETGNYDPALRAGILAAVAELGPGAVEAIRLVEPSPAMRPVIAEIVKTESPAVPARRAPVPGNRNVELRLTGAVSGKDLLIEFAVRDGQWPRTAWGYAPNYNKGDHETTVRRATPTELDLDVTIADDPWVRGGPAQYWVTLEGETGRWRGHYRGTGETGTVAVVVRPPLPMVEPVTPLRLQEHPRLSRRQDGWTAPRQYRPSTGADQSMERVTQPQPPALAVEWARPAMACATLYDAVYWQASPAKRRAGADALLGLGRGLLFAGPGMSTPWHNWQGRWRSGAGIALLAALGDPCSYPLRPPAAEEHVTLTPPPDHHAPTNLPANALNAATALGGNQLGVHWLRGDQPLAARVVDNGNLDLSAALGTNRQQVLELTAGLTNGFEQTVRVGLTLGTRLWVAGQELREGLLVTLPVGLYPVRAEVQGGALPGQVWRVPQLAEVENPQAKLRRWREGFAWWQFHGGASPDATKWVHLAEINCARYIHWAIGEGGFTTEKEGYTSNTLDEMLPFLRALRVCQGLNLVAGSHAEWIPLRAKAGSFGDEGGARFYGGASLGEFLTPAFRQALDAKTPAEFPGHGIRDRQKAGYVFRNGWHGDAEDIFLTVEGKGQHLRGAHTAYDTGTFRLFGLGAAWAVYSSYGRDAPREVHNVVHLPDDPINGLLPAREAHYTVRPDGSGSVSLNLDDVFLAINSEQPAALVDYEGRINPKAVRDLGIRAVRACGADFSGKSGAPGVVVIADKITGGHRRVWAMHLASRVTAEVNGRAFTLRARKTDATVAGTFLLPADVQLKVTDGQLLAAGNTDFLVVMTMQRGPAPKVELAGDRLRIGAQTARFDGEKQVWGE